MVIPRDAVTLENFKRSEAGLAPIPEKKVPREEPEFPKVENQIKFESIPLDKVVRIEAIRKNVVKNFEGVRFIGYDIEIEVDGSESLQGWLMEGDAIRLKKLPWVREKTDMRLLDVIQ